LSEEGCINSHARLQAEKHKKMEKSFDGILRVPRSRLRASKNKRDRGEEMTWIADMKMALLAALIVLTSLLCTPDEDRLGEVDPVLRDVPQVETRVLAG
jgi:hypothetical protein